MQEDHDVLGRHVEGGGRSLTISDHVRVGDHVEILPRRGQQDGRTAGSAAREIQQRMHSLTTEKRVGKRDEDFMLQLLLTNPSILLHSGMKGAADETVLNK